MAFVIIYVVGVILAAVLLSYTLDINSTYGVTVGDLFYLIIASLFSWLALIATVFIWLCIILQDTNFSKFWDYEIIKPAYKRKNK